MDADCLMWLLRPRTAVPTTHSPAPQPWSRAACDSHSASEAEARAEREACVRTTTPLKSYPCCWGWGLRVRGLEGWGWHSPQPILTHNFLSCDLSLFSPQGSTYCHTPNSFFLQLQFSLISHKLFKEWSCHQGANLGRPSQHGASRSQALNIFSCQTVGAAQSPKRNSQWHQRIPAHKPAMRVVAYAKCFKWVLQYRKC